MATTEYKSTAKYGHNKMHFRARPDVPRISAVEKLYERRFIEGRKMFYEVMLEFNPVGFAAFLAESNTNCLCVNSGD